MNSTYPEAMRRGVFPHEGGYTNEAADPGGPTNWGITIVDARMYWKPGATAADVRVMPQVIAEDIYRKHYAAPVRYQDLPAGVDYSVLDYAINSGVGRAGKVLRRLVGLSDHTSAVTDEVIAAVAKRNPADLISAIAVERMAFLRTLKNWPTYANGWARRVAEVRALSMGFAKQQTVTTITGKPVPGKGKIAEPAAAKKAVVVIGGAGGTGLVAWAHRHPALAVLAGMGVVGAIVGIVYLITKWHENRQQAATPGIVPVKEAA